MSHFLGILAAVSLVCCAGTGPNVSNPERENSSSAEVRAEKRRQRRAVRDLETQITKLKAEMTVLKRSDRPAATAGPAALPVEVLEPTNEPITAYQLPEEEYVVAGFDENGMEILYVGDAARTPSASPSIDLSSRRLATATPRPAAAPASLPRTTPAPARPKLQPVPTVDDVDLVASAAIGPKVNRLVSADRAAPPAPVPASLPAVPVTARAPRTFAKDEYRRAHSALKERRHDEAIELFRAFLVAHPRHPYADNAQYWLGEAFYDMRRFATARDEFGKVVADHPSGNKVPAAKLKAAYCFLELGEPATAKALLAELMAEHPNTGPANLASKKLKSL